MSDDDLTPEQRAADEGLDAAVYAHLDAYGHFDDSAGLVTGYVVVGSYEGKHLDRSMYFRMFPSHGMQAVHTSIGLLEWGKARLLEHGAPDEEDA